MNQTERIWETLATYTRHGWRLARVLLTPETRAELTEAGRNLFEDVEVREAPFDGLWFARHSLAGREAWELRLVSETAYALFETFESEETDEEREEVRREMEARIAEYVMSA